MKRLICILTCLFLLGNIGVYAQRPALKVGNNPASLNSSAALEVESTEKGFLPPRVTNAQMNAIVNPDQGLIVYCTDCSPVGLRVNNGSNLSPNWQSFGGASSTSSVLANCTSAGFSSGVYLANTPVSGLNFSVTITNNTFSTVVITFAASDLVLSGLPFLGTLAVGTPTGGTNFSNGQGTLTAGQSVTVTYPISGSTGSCGILTGVWSKLNLSCTKTLEILPNINCSGGAWTTAIAPAPAPGLVAGTSYSGTFSFPVSVGVCSLPAESYTVNGLTLSFSGSTNNTSGSISYNLSGTYTGTTGGTIFFTTSKGCTTGTCINNGMLDSQDFDCDGIINSIDLDDDNDGVPDDNEMVWTVTDLNPNPSSNNYINSGHWGGHAMWNNPILGSSTAWAGGSDNSTNQAIGTYFFGGTYRVKGVRTQGNAAMGEWLTSYELLAIKNGGNWVSLGTYGGNSDQNTVVYREVLNTDLNWVGAYIRPLTWRGHPSVRFQFQLWSNPVEKDTDGDGIVDRLDRN